MRRPVAALVATAFFAAAPGTTAGLVPWLITGWRLPDGGTPWRVAQGLGVVLIVVGLVPPVHAFAAFVRAGGTPMPLTPTQHLVVTGFNRHLRNPMYAGLILVIAGQALLFRNGWLILWAAVFWATTASFVRWYEEPALAQQFGAEYRTYRHHVPAWYPRLSPWTARPDQET